MIRVDSLVQEQNGWEQSRPVWINPDHIAAVEFQKPKFQPGLQIHLVFQGDAGHRIIIAHVFANTDEAVEHLEKIGLLS